MKRRMNQQVASKGVQLVTISRPTAYGEYAPYTFIEDEKGRRLADASQGAFG